MKSTDQTISFLFRCVAIALAMLLSACGSFPQQSYPGNQQPSATRVAGLVNYVDTYNSVIEITTTRDYQVTPGQRLGLNYNNRTTVEYDGNRYRPSDLESGDRIIAAVEGDSRNLRVHSIVVTHNSSSEGNNEPDFQYISGTLKKLNKSNKNMIIRTDDREREVKVKYNKRTEILLNNRSIKINDLQENERLEIKAKWVSGNNNPVAQSIVVDRRGSSDNGDQFDSARGQIVNVDDRRRELVIATQDRRLQSTSSNGSSNPSPKFDPSHNNRITFRYEEYVPVIYQGKHYGPTNLEQGDTVEVGYERVGRNLWARRIQVISSVR